MPRAVSILDGERLRQELRRLNLTQKQFGDMAGLRQMTVSDAVTNKPLLPITIFLIAVTLERAIMRSERKERKANAR